MERLKNRILEEKERSYVEADYPKGEKIQKIHFWLAVLGWDQKTQLASPVLYGIRIACKNPFKRRAEFGLLWDVLMHGLLKSPYIR